MRTRGYEIVEAWHAAVNAGDADRATALVQSEVEVAGPRGSGHGRELVREWVGRAGVSLELRRGFACGQTVVVEQAARWPSERSGEEQLVASVFEVHDGCIARIARHPTLESALQEGCLRATDAVVASSPAPSSTVRGLHHIALATRDLDRLGAFYSAVFGADFVDGRPGPGIITIGGSALHVFEQPKGSLGGTPAEVAGQPSSSGRVHHFSLELSDLDGFTAVRERLLARAATYGEVTDFGDHVSLFFNDPDGYFCELTLRKPSNWRPPFETVPHEPRRLGLSGVGSRRDQRQTRQVAAIAVGVAREQSHAGNGGVSADEEVRQRGAALPAAASVVEEELAGDQDVCIDERPPARAIHHGSPP